MLTTTLLVGLLAAADPVPFAGREPFSPTPVEIPELPAAFEGDRYEIPYLAIGAEPGMVVGDIGCGRGKYTFRIADVVGEQGAVICRDTSEHALDGLLSKMLEVEAMNVDARLSAKGDILVDAQTLDLALLADVFQFVLHQEETTDDFVDSLYHAMKPGGIVVMTWVTSDRLWSEEKRRPLYEGTFTHMTARGFEPGRRLKIDDGSDRPAMLMEFRRPPSEPLFREVTFAAADGLEVTADLYTSHARSAPFIVLCHQAGWSRGEYREIAPKLGALGFNCLAIDQRSGKGVNDVRNETAQRATSEGNETGFVDAMADLDAAVAYARTHHARGALLLWGSSYSAALALKFAGDHPDRIDGVLAFAPGEYFGRFGKPGDWIAQSARSIVDPVFITSAQREKDNWWSIWGAIPGETKAYFLPETVGQHGSRALWVKFDDHPGYWAALRAFLRQFRKWRSVERLRFAVPRPAQSAVTHGSSAPASWE